MTLDELLKQNAAWFDEALKRPAFDKVDSRTANFPQQQRMRRIAELEARVEHLSRRKEEANAAYDRAIAAENAELEDLKRQQPPTPGVAPHVPPTGPGAPPTDPAGPSRGRRAAPKAATRKE
jgi:hypothetical protein